MLKLGQIIALIREVESVENKIQYKEEELELRAGAKPEIRDQFIEELAELKRTLQLLNEQDVRL